MPLTDLPPDARPREKLRAALELIAVRVLNRLVGGTGEPFLFALSGSL